MNDILKTSDLEVSEKSNLLFSLYNFQTKWAAVENVQEQRKLPPSAQVNQREFKTMGAHQGVI